MSLPPDRLLQTLAMAQMTIVAPALEGSYAGGAAATVALGVLALAQDAVAYEARRARTAEAAAAILADAGVAVPDGHDARLEALDRLLAGTADPALERRILDLYVAMTEAALITLPAMPA
jgi:hypothetical protein